MMKKFLDWWNADKIRLERLEKQLEELASDKKAAEEELEAASAELAEAREELEKTTNDHYSSTEPWVDIKSERIDPIKGLVIELDWNDAFIQYLKDNGISARDDETAVQKWVAMLYQNLMQDLEAVSIDKSDAKPRVNDFE